MGPIMQQECHCTITGVLICPQPDQEGNKLMFLSEWREFPSARCLAGKTTWWQLASRCCWNCTRPWHASKLVSFLVGLRTYQHPGSYCVLSTVITGINTSRMTFKLHTGYIYIYIYIHTHTHTYIHTYIHTYMCVCVCVCVYVCV